MTDWPIDWRVVVDEARRRRQREGLSQRALADLAGVSPPTVNSFEQGDINLRFERVIAILQALGMFVHSGSGDAFDSFIYDARRRWEELVAPLPASDPARQPQGHSEQAYAIGDLPALASLKSLREALEENPKTSGWTPFWVPTRDDMRPYVENGLLECWLGSPEVDRHFKDAAHSDFWRVTREGRAYLHRGFQEDGFDNLDPGTIFDVSLPVWRSAEVLLHAAYLARALGGTGATQIAFRARYAGLEGRELANWSQPRLRFLIGERQRARSSQVDLAIRAAVGDIETDLAGTITRLLAPLYERFDGYAVEPDFVGQQLADLRNSAQFEPRIV